MEAGMNVDIVRLLDLLEQEERMLRKHNEVFWANWLKEGGTLLKAGDFRGITHVLDGFGGMESLNDLLISPLNGHVIDEANSREVNSAIQKLLSAIHALASAISDKRGA